MLITVGDEIDWKPEFWHSNFEHEGGRLTGSFLKLHKVLPMIYKPYGITGLKVSNIGFGGMRFRDQENVEQCTSLVKAAYDAGINYFDTAVGYGKSEELMGSAFREMKKTRAERPFYVSSKTTAADESSVRRDLETSLNRLGLDYLDFYHVWCILSPDAWKTRREKGVLRAFEKMKAEGLVHNISVSTHMTGNDIGAMLADYPFAGVLMGYSAMNHAYREAGVAAAAARRMGVVVMNPLGGGIIPGNPEKFAFVKTRPDETVVEGALRFLLNDPRITVVLVGLSDQQQLSEAIRAVDGFQSISDEQLAAMRDRVSAVFNEMCTGCGYCDKCPEGIPIPKLMDAYNHYLLSGKPQDLVNRLNWQWGISTSDAFWKHCVECGQCEEACTQHLSIIQRLKEISAEVDRLAVSK